MEAVLNVEDRLQHILGVLDPRLQTFLADQDQPCPAVDLASGYGYFPLAYLHHFTSLEWYPTDYNGMEDPVFREGKFGDMLSLTWILAQAAAEKKRCRPGLQIQMETH